jgi:hypothetical protein
MAFAIHSINPDYPTIFVEKQSVAPDADGVGNIQMWDTTHDHVLSNGRRIRVLIIWTTCPDFPNSYEPIAELGEDGTPIRFLTGMLQPDMTYKHATSADELDEFTKPVSLLNPATGDMYRMPYSAMCVSATLRNMVDDLGFQEDTPIPIFSNIINGTILNTLRLFRMMRVVANPSCGSETIKNWFHSEVPDINCELRIPQIDVILKALPALDETMRETEIATAVGYPQFKFVKGWTDHVALDYYITAVDFLDIQSLCMYIAHAYASKMANI